MIHTFIQRTHTLAPAPGGGYFVIGRERGHSVGKVVRVSGYWRALRRSPTASCGFEPTGGPAHHTRAAAATECMHVHFGYPIPVAPLVDRRRGARLTAKK